MLVVGILWMCIQGGRRQARRGRRAVEERGCTTVREGRQFTEECGPAKRRYRRIAADSHCEHKLGRSRTGSAPEDLPGVLENILFDQRATLRRIKTACPEEGSGGKCLDRRNRCFLLLPKTAGQLVSSPPHIFRNQSRNLSQAP